MRNKQIAAVLLVASLILGAIPTAHAASGFTFLTSVESLKAQGAGGTVDAPPPPPPPPPPPKTITSSGARAATGTTAR